MAHTAREFHRSPSELFAVIADPATYPDWLVGTSKIRDIEHNFPSPGATFRHTVGMRPFAVPDLTVVRDVEPDRSLTLSVRARPLFSAEVIFRIVGDDERSVVTIEEEPTLRLLGNVLRPLVDPVIHHRNHRSLRRLEALMDRRRVVASS
jgi:uncharacterized protein YndB with AHSA1/START domain